MAKKKLGRPTKYGKKLAAAVCKLIAEEGLTLRRVGEREGMPDRTTIRRWLGAHEEFRLQYALACEVRADLFSDEILDIADDGTNDWMEKEGKGGRVYKAVDQEHVQRSRMRMDARKWLMSKLLPKKYGDRLDTTHHAGEGWGDVLSAVHSSNQMALAPSPKPTDEEK